LKTNLTIPSRGSRFDTLILFVLFLFIEKTKLDQSRGDGLDLKDSATIIM